MTWWLWFLLGMALLLAEALTPGGFVLLLFGVAALAVGLLAGTGIVLAAWGQWLLFGLFSIALLAGLRVPLMRRLRRPQSKDVDSMIGETAFTLTEIGVNDFGKAELRGTTWSARNVGAAALVAGQRCRVTAVDGFTLYISKERSEEA
jgi:membrane protein implicated in regulation of membrane protease activity